MIVIVEAMGTGNHTFFLLIIRIDYDHHDHPSVRRFASVVSVVQRARVLNLTSYGRWQQPASSLRAKQLAAAELQLTHDIRQTARLTLHITYQTDARHTRYGTGRTVYRSR
jgi:hypothetical protein